DGSRTFWPRFTLNKRARQRDDQGQSSKRTHSMRDKNTIGNGTWVCFDCRQTVRRPVLWSLPVSCPQCGALCTGLETQTRIPAKRNAKAWHSPREIVAAQTVAAQ